MQFARAPSGVLECTPFPSHHRARAAATDTPWRGALEYTVAVFPWMRAGSWLSPHPLSNTASTLAPQMDVLASPKGGIVTGLGIVTIVRIGVLTGGGDCPGLNAVIRAIVRRGIDDYGHEIVGFRDGWRGPIEGVTRSSPSSRRAASCRAAAPSCAPRGRTRSSAMTGPS